MTLRSALLAALLLTACTGSTGPPSPAASSNPPPLALHWMSFQHHGEPRYQLLFEGGEPGSFSELRLLGADGTPIATAAALPSAAETIRMCSGSKTNQPAPTYGALRATLTLATQQQFGDVLKYPDRYRIEVLTGGQWRPTLLVHDCDAQE